MLINNQTLIDEVYQDLFKEIALRDTLNVNFIEEKFMQDHQSRDLLLVDQTFEDEMEEISRETSDSIVFLMNQRSLKSANMEVMS